MHILIATSGALAPGPAALFTARLVDEGDTVSVITVIEVPRSFLDEIRSEEWHPLGDDRPWGPHEDVIGRYVEERGRRLTDPLLAALRAEGIEAEVNLLEGEEPAQTILEVAEKRGADLIILGATRPIFDEASWESVSLRVIQDGRQPVLIVPAQPRPAEDDEPTDA